MSDFLDTVPTRYAWARALLFKDLKVGDRFVLEYPDEDSPGRVLLTKCDRDGYPGGQEVASQAWFQRDEPGTTDPINLATMVVYTINVVLTGFGLKLEFRGYCYLDNNLELLRDCHHPGEDIEESEFKQIFLRRETMTFREVGMLLEVVAVT